MNTLTTLTVHDLLKTYNTALPALFLSITLVNCSGGSDSGSTVSEANTDTPSSVVPMFVDVTDSVGVNLFHGFSGGRIQTMPMMFSGGVAADDYDNDGDIDFYIVAGDLGQNHLYQNQGNATFVDVSQAAGVAIANTLSTGPAFADVDGDGWLDLFVGSIEGDPVYLFKNNGDGTFTDVTAASGLDFQANNTVSTTFGDVDNDGDIDLLAAHWGHPMSETASREIIWRNDSVGGNIVFVDVSTDWGMNVAYSSHLNEEDPTDHIPDSAFVPSLSDIDGDHDLDLLLVSDFGRTKVLRNDDGTGFTNITSDAITDQNGMGSAVGDFDNDGDMDWYVTSIHFKENDGGVINQSVGFTGNRLYSNDGSGNFNNLAVSLGVADGGWGWGSCFADFNNDGRLDIFHVNGWGQNSVDFAQYQNDFSRMFIQNVDGTFSEVAVLLGFATPRQGRGLACNDFDRDGDIDIVTSNNQDSARFFRNTSSAEHNSLTIQLRSPASNTRAIGAKIEVSDQRGMTQTREVRVNNNFTSTNASEVHFGFGVESRSVVITVTWPGGNTTRVENAALNQLLTINESM